MARVAFIFEPGGGSLREAVAQRLIRGLADNQHQIRVICDRHFEPGLMGEHSRLEWLRTLDRWRIFELPQLIKALIPFQPDIVHFLPAQNGSALSLMAVAPWALRPLSRAAFAVTLLGPAQAGRHDNVLRWIEACDLVVTPFSPPNHSPSLRLPRWEHLNLPLGISPAKDSGLNEGSLVAFVPGRPEDYSEFTLAMKSLIAALRTNANWSVRLGTSWDSLPVRQRLVWRETIAEAGLSDRLRCSGDLSERQLAQEIVASDLVLLSALQESSLIFHYALQVARLAARPLLAKQLNLRLPGDCLARVEQWPERMGRLERINLAAITRELESQTKDGAEDRSANQLSRLYSKLLHS